MRHIIRHISLIPNITECNRSNIHVSYCRNKIMVSIYDFHTFHTHIRESESPHIFDLCNLQLALLAESDFLTNTLCTSSVLKTNDCYSTASISLTILEASSNVIISAELVTFAVLFNHENTRRSCLLFLFNTCNMIISRFVNVLHATIKFQSFYKYTSFECKQYF